MRSENTMTVDELIDALRGFPGAAEVHIYIPAERGATRGFDYINTVESAAKDTVILSNHGFWPDVYKDPELAGQIMIPDFDDHEASGLFEED